MKIHLINDKQIEVSEFHQDAFDISLASEALYFGAMPMFVASLARCTFAVLENYAMRLDVESDTITMLLNWDYASQPTRISEIQMLICWPDLPASRLKAVQRAAHLCTIHNTINNCVNVETVVEVV